MRQIILFTVMKSKMILSSLSVSATILPDILVLIKGAELLAKVHIRLQLICITMM